MIKFLVNFFGCKFATIYGRAVLKERLGCKIILCCETAGPYDTREDHEAGIKAV